MKRILLFFTAAVLVFGLALTAAGSVEKVKKELNYADVKIMLDGVELTPTDVNGGSTEPFIIDGTTYVPLRAIASALGLEVGWDDETKTVLLDTPKMQKTVYISQNGLCYHRDEHCSGETYYPAPFGTALDFGLAPCEECVLAKEIDSAFIESAVRDLCSQKLYSQRDAYDTGHMLMMPLRYGFITGNEVIVFSFQNLFLTFLHDDGENKAYFDEEMTGLDRNHFLYLMSEYMVYCVDYGFELDQEIFDTVVAYMVKYNETYTHNFGGKAVYHSFQDLMDGLLHGVGYDRSDSINHLLSDNDTFPLAILCDCLYVQRKRGFGTEYTELLEWGGACAEEMMKTQVEWTEEGGWIFQPGGWTHHIDFYYAGYTSLEELDPEVRKMIPGIGSDTSHFRRFASFLNSYARVAEDRDYFTRLKVGLADQFMNVMVEKRSDPVEYYIMKNFTDGNNGVYRYRQETGRAYGPYQLSTSMLDGWWSLLDDNRITAVYRSVYYRLRLEDSLPEIYRDPFTTRERNPFYTNIDNYRMMTYIASLGL